jgi:hypothetical protein
MAREGDRDPTDALSRAASFPVRRVSSPPSPPESEHPAPSSTFDGEDFLFHLYRGNELLQDNLIGEAKEELERALRLQPRDVEGQSLLGVVYFRLGHYPRAIEIYEELIRGYPNEITPRVNLALCYLKTGQQMHAREALEDVLRREPNHRRAWGYYGLVLERLGEYDRAQHAFERAGQPQLAARMVELIARARPESQPPQHDAERAEVRRAAADAVAELEANVQDPSLFSRAQSLEPETQPHSSRWRAVELAEEQLPPVSRPTRSLSPPGRSLTPPGRMGIPSLPAAVEPAAAPLARSLPPGPTSGVPGTPSALIQQTIVAWPEPGRRLNLVDSLALIRVHVGIAVRNDCLRAVHPEGNSFRRTPLLRRHRGRDTHEPFGGPTSWSLLEGAGALALAGTRGRALSALEIGNEFIYVREARLLAFDASVRFENGRLPAPPNEPTPIAIVQLSGSGLLVLEGERPLRALAVSADRPVIVHGLSVAGWTGRLLAEPLTTEDSPTHSHGFVAFNGDGAVLLDDA